jgi:pullulanase
MQTRCGAWQVNDDATHGRVEFRMFFPAGPDPEIGTIHVAGNFQQQLGGSNWDFAGGLPLTKDTSNPRGTFWTARTDLDLPAGFYQYKYLVTFNDGSTRKVSDPCTRYSGLSDQNAAVVVGGSRPAQNTVRPLASGRKPPADLNVYELMIDDFTDEFRGTRAPLAAVIDRLDYLRDLGFNAILFMPWTAWRNQDFDWGYEPLQYFAVESRYANQPGRPEEKLSWLKRLVSECHDRDIHVIMDGVFNHVSTDFPYKAMYRSPDRCPYTRERVESGPPLLSDTGAGWRLRVAK